MSPFRASAPLTDTWEHFRFSVSEGIGTVTLDRPGKLNALTFEAYADLRDLLAELPHRGDTRVLVIRGKGRAFCSGGDVNEIIGATLAMSPDELLAFTRMSGEVIREMRDCPVPVIAAVHGMAAGAGAVIDTTRTQCGPTISAYTGTAATINAWPSSRSLFRRM